MKITTALLRLAQYVLLTILFAVIYVTSSMSLASYLPPLSLAEPGPIPSPLDILLVCAVQALVIMIILLSARWHGWKLALAGGFAYYGVTTFMAEIEAWYFLADLTLPPGLLPRMFLAGLAPAFIFIPMAVLVLWKVRRTNLEAVEESHLPAKQWAWKLALLAPIYLLLYFGAGYFIAWQNPEVRSFYHGTNPANFLLALGENWQNDPGLFIFQAARSWAWVLFALPVLRMTRGSAWYKAFVVGLLLGVPMNIGHILANPLIPAASVRFSHMIETSSSTFLFGMAITWLLHRRHSSLADLFGIRPANQRGLDPVSGIL
ncbi:MAG: hypothetical protein IH586_07050 [Anaerolineaceae bacterium]|nr:hypothetical protein [Anaerolineaceae bacterium]